MLKLRCIFLRGKRSVGVRAGRLTTTLHRKNESLLVVCVAKADALVAFLHLTGNNNLPQSLIFHLIAPYRSVFRSQLQVDYERRAANETGNSVCGAASPLVHQQVLLTLFHCEFGASAVLILAVQM